MKTIILVLIVIICLLIPRSNKPEVKRIVIDGANRTSIELENGAYDYLTDEEFKTITGIEINTTFLIK